MAPPAQQSPLMGQQLPVLSFGKAMESEPQLPPFARVIEPSLSNAIATATSTPLRQQLLSQQSFVSEDNLVLDHSVEDAVRAVAKAKRVAVVCGAGISCASGIPDFRSSEGLFNSLKQAHPDAKLSSGKDLFDANLFASEANAAIFYTMIAELRTMADNAVPTAFHRLLKTLDDEGKLFRVYTQNIDGLEEKAGLSYGLGNRINPPSAVPSKQPSPTPTPEPSLPDLNPTPFHFSFAEGDHPMADATAEPVVPHQRRRSPRSISPTPSTPSTPPSLPIPEPLPTFNISPSASTSAAAVTPRCIPLHGHLSTLSCPACHTTYPLSPFLPTLKSGTSSACPKCVTVDGQRSVLGERSRGIGRLKPDVVLYGENHKDGDRVGEITRKDLMGVRPDLLIVVGTSLKVPGTKLLVRELSKVIKPNVNKGKGKGKEEDYEPPASSQNSTTSNSSTVSRRSKPKSPPIHTIYLNYEFPKPSREFQGTFDVWLRGDVQEFVGYVEKERGEMVERLRERERKKVESAKKEADKANSKVPAKVAASKKSPAAAKGKARATTPTTKQPKKTAAAPALKKAKATQVKLTGQFASSKAGTTSRRK